MKNKDYYMDLADRWFDALLTGNEERELKSFLATSDDPDFDEVKAVAGFFATGKALTPAQADAPRRTAPLRFRWTAAFAVAASLALVAVIGLHRHRDECYIQAYGEKSTDLEQALESMNATLTDLFAAAPDIETELETLWK